MDAVLFITLAVIMTIRNIGDIDKQASVAVTDAEITVDNTNRVSKLNENFYECPDAFTVISRTLGF